jgi:hypothetical protein
MIEPYLPPISPGCSGIRQQAYTLSRPIHIMVAWYYSQWLDLERTCPPDTNTLAYFYLPGAFLSFYNIKLLLSPVCTFVQNFIRIIFCNCFVAKLFQNLRFNKHSQKELSRISSFKNIRKLLGIHSNFCKNILKKFQWILTLKHF